MSKHNFPNHTYPPHPPANRGLPEGSTVRLDPRTIVCGGGAVLVGGSPWKISRLSPFTKNIVLDLQRRGAQGRPAATLQDLAVYRELVNRGFAFLLPGGKRNVDGVNRINIANSDRTCGTVVPAMDRPESLKRCLDSLAGRDVTVVDDGSIDCTAIANVVHRSGFNLISLPVNVGPAGARNAGFAASEGEFVAFIDSDCTAPIGWPNSMLHHFDDPLVAAVAPRVLGRELSSGVIERYERTRSSLDMGSQAELVRPGSRLGFIPSAAFIIRRSAFVGFDENLRVGEDVDLMWNLVEAGWHVCYDPEVIVHHDMRTNLNQWLIRRFQYGTSAPELEIRHPGNLTPARLSAWNITVFVLVAWGKPVAATSVVAVAMVALGTSMRAMPGGIRLAGRVVGQGLLADSASIGHLLRREWWPVGVVALALVPKSRLARLGALAMLAPMAFEWLSRDRYLDPVRYTALRLADDASYGFGVIASSIRVRNFAPLLPKIRLPKFGKLGSQGVRRP